ncbi:ATP-binding cassette domain-containing protein [Thermoproteota archaeon]
MGGRLELKSINKDFNGFRITNLTLTVEPSKYLVIIGPTGAGKTLLLETIQGFHQLDSGEILLDDADITRLPQQQRRIAYVPQNSIFPPQNTVKQILEYGTGLFYRNMAHIIEGITNMMNMNPHLNRQVVTLSGGERRKLALARALIQQPKVLLLDEPLNNLDIISQKGLCEEIRLIHKYLDLTTIHVTHDQTEALTMADELAVIRDGDLRAEGTVEQVYNDPRDEYAARFFGYRNIYQVSEYQHGVPYTKAKINGISLRTSLIPDIDQEKIAIHGAEIILHKKTPVNTSDNLYQGTITEMFTTGPTVYITTDIGLPITLTMGRRPFQAAKIEKGERIWVQFSTEAVKPIKA